MKAQELRIGNWVADRGGKKWQIHCWESANKVAEKEPEWNSFGMNLRGHPFTEYVDFLQPIPLTEEWLLKFGFEFWCDELGVKCYYKVYGVEFFCVATNGFWQIRAGLKTSSASWGMHNYPFLKHVHQLQNLYFALTGEELTFIES